MYNLEKVILRPSDEEKRGIAVMKKISILLFVLLFLLTSAVIAQDGSDMDGDAEAQSHLTIGNTTPMHGKTSCQI